MPLHYSAVSCTYGMAGLMMPIPEVTFADACNMKVCKASLEAHMCTLTENIHLEQSHIERMLKMAL